MNRSEWSALTTAEEMARRAGGRRRYNAWLRTVRELRRWEILNRSTPGCGTCLAELARRNGWPLSWASHRA